MIHASSSIRRLDLDNAWTAAALYLAIVVGVTWPLVLGLTADLPTDLGDPVFVSWALTRASVNWTALLRGDVSVLSTFWDARIFHPAPLTGAYSEHFAGHALLTLPVWWASGNVVLCYNLLFIGSSVLCGVGMYLLVRDVTGRGKAAFVAGVCFACAPYRVATASHLQVQSAQFMPFALLLLRRYVVDGRPAALAGAVAALWLQNLSSGYYMLYFAPLAGLWSGCWLIAERQWMRWRRVAGLVGAGGLTLLLTLPFALPYLAVRRALGAPGRPVEELALYSADLAAWATASPFLNVWGHLRTFPRVEGELFTGVTLPLLLILGLVNAGVSRDRTHRTLAIFSVLAGTLAFWMALGPRPSVMGRPLPLPSLYAVASEHLPGFSVARAPARFHMIVLLAGSMLAGLGAGALAPRGWAIAAVAAAAVLEGAAVPFPRNVNWTPTTEARKPPDRVTPTRPPAVYGYLRTLGPQAVIAHFPYGASEHDLRYMLYSAAFRSAMINGYSGAFPPDWDTRIARLSWPMRNVDLAWTYLEHLGATHAVIHTDVWPDDTGHRLAEAIEQRGARLAFRAGADLAYQLPFAPGANTTNGR